MIITLDGPAGSGKSTIARMLAQRLGIEYIDSGAMYRTLTLYGIRQFGQAQGHEAQIAQYFAQAPQALQVSFEAHAQVVRLNGEEVTQAIRDPELTRQIRYVAGFGPCRDYVNASMRELAQAYSVVVDGRDIGTLVFPESKNKFYLDADPKIRAERRALELGQPTSGPTFEALVKEINDRDHSDMTRDLAPLVCPPDAHRIDTSRLDRPQVLAAIEARLQAD
ncbi:MAG: (d)CMP kinase [bacterium]|nr:(d)CMP kinase [bacterium]